MAWLKVAESCRKPSWHSRKCGWRRYARNHRSGESFAMSNGRPPRAPQSIAEAGLEGAAWEAEAEEEAAEEAAPPLAPRGRLREATEAGAAEDEDEDEDIEEEEEEKEEEEEEEEEEEGGFVYYRTSRPHAGA